eukprot:GHVP01040746.1.p1 GENE.GHVP01040746.1~~GHVP01040746.1.p1  ORF type:complete len:202 (-),score=45.16 GHVP01040746.1:71-676(-)
MTKVILHYLPVAGRGYVPRMVMEYGGINYKKYSMDEIKADKETFPFGMGPDFEIDGKIWHQSLAVALYLATKAGLLGDDSAETRYRITEVVGIVEDYMGRMANTMRMKTDEEKLSTLDELNKWGRSHFAALDKKLASNSKCAIGDQITYADLALYVMARMTRSGMFDRIDKDINDLPIFDKSVKAVESEPKLKKFISEHPI